MRVLRVKLRSRTGNPDLGKAFGNGVHSRGILHSQTEMVQAWAQRIMSVRQTVSGSKDKSKMAIVILNVPISIVYEFVLAKSEDRHQPIVKLFRSGKVRNSYVDVVDSDDFGVHSGGQQIVS